MKTLSPRTGFTLIVTFTMCNAYSMLFGTDCGRDVWLAHLIAAALALLIWALFTGTFERYEYTSFFDMIDTAFGKIFGRIFVVILILYALLSATTTLGIFSRFTQLTALSKTPSLILPLIISLLAVFSLKFGICTLSRGADLFFYFAVFTFAAFIFFGIPVLDIKNIFPILDNGIVSPVKSSFSIFTNQFGDTLLLFALYPEISKKNRRSSMLWAIFTATLATSIIALFTIMTIGENQLTSDFFPVFTTLSIRNIGGYIQHTEVITSIAMAFFIFIRQAVTLYFAASALAYLFRIKEKVHLYLPLSLLVASGSQLMYPSMMNLRTRIEGDLNLYILLPVLLVFPCVLCTLLLIKRKKT